jgi:hypothetical protein
VHKVSLQKTKAYLDAGIETFICLQTSFELQRFAPYRDDVLSHCSPEQKKRIKFVHFPIEGICG